ncbi:hypothetical protein Dimus_015113 [Dionaea muscipula]
MDNHNYHHYGDDQLLLEKKYSGGARDIHDLQLQLAADPIHGDVLEVLLSHVPLIDLVPACLVSKSWNDAVSSSLSLLNPIKPWLLIHTHSLLSPSSSSSSTHAFDPRSRSWVRINHRHQSIPCSSDLISSSDFLYALTPSKLSFSTDPLHLTWRNVDPPRTWRVDPLVALVGSHIVVAGGGSEYEDDPLAVEVYDLERSPGAGRWEACQSMPMILKDSAARTWLSVAANSERMFVTEKASGMTYRFSPESKVWDGPYDLSPDPRVFFSTVGFTGRDMVLAGLIGHAHDVRGLKLWRVTAEMKLREPPIGEVPAELIEELKGGDDDELSSLSSIAISSTEDFVYIYNSVEPRVLIYGQLSGDGDRIWRWQSVPNMIWKEKKIMERMVLSVGRVELADLQSAVSRGNCRFKATEYQNLNLVSRKESTIHIDTIAAL